MQTLAGRENMRAASVRYSRFMELRAQGVAFKKAIRQARMESKLRYALQLTFDWEEEKHPRDEGGKFASKDTVKGDEGTGSVAQVSDHPEQEPQASTSKPTEASDFFTDSEEEPEVSVKDTQHRDTKKTEASESKAGKRDTITKDNPSTHGEDLTQTPEKQAPKATKKPAHVQSQDGVMLMRPEVYLRLAMPFGHQGGPAKDEGKVKDIATGKQSDHDPPMLSVKEAGMEKKTPKKQGTSAQAPKANEEGKKKPPQARQRSKEEVEEERERQRAQQQWDDLKAGPFGELFPGLGDRPHSIRRTWIAGNPWKDYAEKIGNEKVTQAGEYAKERVISDYIAGVTDYNRDGRTDAELRAAIEDHHETYTDPNEAQHFFTKKHMKAVPNTLDGQHWLSEWLEGADMSRRTEVNEYLKALEKGEAPAVEHRAGVENEPQQQPAGDDPKGPAGITKAQAVAKAMEGSTRNVASYAQAVAATYAYTGTKSSDWKAPEILNMREVDDGEGGKAMAPEFDRPEGTSPVETPWSGENSCELCGHTIKQAYPLYNQTAGQSMTVGSECVTRFQVDGKSGKRVQKEAEQAHRRNVLQELHDARKKLGERYGTLDTRTNQYSFDRHKLIREYEQANTPEDWTPSSADKVYNNRAPAAVRDAAQRHAKEVERTWNKLQAITTTSRGEPIYAKDTEEQRYTRDSRGYWSNNTRAVKVDAASHSVITRWHKKNADEARELLTQVDDHLGSSQQEQPE